jgi:hypothetical protein
MPGAHWTELLDPRERSRLGAIGPPTDRRVREGDAPEGQPIGDAARGGGIAGGAIQKERASARPARIPSGPKREANSAARTAVRFQTVSGQRGARRAAMGVPMAPRPRNPTTMRDGLSGVG